MDGFTQFDGNLLISIQKALYADWLTPIMKGITMLGEGGILLIAICILLMIFRRTRRLGIICSLSLLLTFICCNLVLKPMIDRDRPWDTFAAVNAMLPAPGDASFPSGHSANSMAVAWALFINTLPIKHIVRNENGTQTGTVKSYSDVPCLGWKGIGADPRKAHALGIVAVVLAVLVGISRLYLGMHYPSDVFCGLILGMICATIVHVVIKKAEQKRGIIGG